MQIRRGITRTVLITRRYAIKLPSLRAHGQGFAGRLWSACRGVLANQCEAQWWGHATPEMRPHLCPVLHSRLGGIVNVYPRCEPYEVSEQQWVDMTERDWHPIPQMWPRPGDNKPENYGWLHGRLVYLDYDMNWNGCPHDRSGALNQADQEKGNVAHRG